MISKEMNWANIYDGGDARKIIKNLYSKKDYEELHRAMWSWLSFDGTRDEAEWFDTFGIPKVMNHCFACEMAELAWKCCPTPEEEDDERPPFCCCCPITDWAEEYCLNGLYGKWLTTYLKEREEVAWQIASMEWNGNNTK